MEYRVNLPYGSSEAIIHEVSCGYVDDAMKGPYATRGAAVDGGFLLRSLVRECTGCIQGEKRINFDEGEKRIDPDEGEKRIDMERSSNHLAWRHKWIREDDLAVLYLYHLERTMNEDIDAKISTLGRKTGIKPSSIRMRLGNFLHLDPNASGKGLYSAAQLTRDIWAEYEADPVGTIDKAFYAYMDFVRE